MGNFNEETYHEDAEEFRDTIATVDESGKRIWIYPKKPSGKFYNYRKIVSYVLLVILIGLPFIKINGEPLFLFNVLESEFRLFGVYFAPQDVHLFAIATLIGIIFIALFTVIFGRLFCGWVCPQTIFMEMVFRRIEYWIEGDARQQRKLNKQPWTTDKTIKKISKHAIFLLISAGIAHIFLSYIIGVDAVWEIMTDPIGEHWKGLIGMIIFTLTFYGVFAKLREQVCTTICPYGRMQGVLLDEDSLTVAYDFVRGEPRGPLKRKKKMAADIINVTQEEPVLGDCIDCTLCVQVCPTGIDIRNGTQLECVNCTACMDACDEVMEKIDRPKGLIRLDSYNGIKNKTHNFWNTRAIAYTGVLLLLIGLEVFLFMSRSSVETLMLRTPGMLYQEQEDDYISNLYNYQLINKTDEEYNITFAVEDADWIIFQPVGQPPVTKPNGVAEGAIFIKIPRDSIKGRKTNLSITVYGDGEEIDQAKTTFLGPG